MAVANVVAVVLLLPGLLEFGLLMAEASAVENSSCPVMCTCSSWLLSCIGKGAWHRLPNVPFIRGSAYIFNTLEFGENNISSVHESNWLPYRWTETLDLHKNELSILQKDSFEGLILVKKLNLSGNVISKIAGYTFQALPFLEVLDLSYNKINKLSDGTFKSWHGLRFFRLLTLKANPLEVIQNNAFDKLPSMEFLDLSGTALSIQMMFPAFMAVPNIAQLIVPDAVRCCLCYIARTIEILFKVVNAECADSCTSEILCDATETYLMVNGTVLRSQMSLKNHKIMGLFSQHNAPGNRNLTHKKRKPLARSSSKLGLLHQIEDNKNSLYVGNHLGPNLKPEISNRKNRQPETDRNKYKPHFSEAPRHVPNFSAESQHHFSNQMGLKHERPPLPGRKHQLLPKQNADDEQNSDSKHKVIKRVKREQPSFKEIVREEPLEIKEASGIGQLDEFISENNIEMEELKDTSTKQDEGTINLYEDSPLVEQDTVMLKGMKVKIPKVNDVKLYESIVESPVEESSLEIVQENQFARSSENASLKSGNTKLPVKPLDAGDLRRSIHEKRMNDFPSTPYNQDQNKMNISDKPWYSPIGTFMENSLSNSSQLQNEAELNEPHRLPQFPSNANRTVVEISEESSEQPMKKRPHETEITIIEETLTTHSPQSHNRKLIKESIKSMSSNESAGRTNVDDLFETKVNEEVKAVEPNKDIQTLFAHVIRIIKIDCLKPKLKAACTELLAKIGHLMKQYEGKEYLPEFESWKPSLLRPDETDDDEEVTLSPEPELVLGEHLVEPEGEQTESEITKIPNKSGSSHGHPSGHHQPEIVPEHKRPATLSSVEYGHKLLLAIAVTVVVMIIIAVVCLIEICSQRSDKNTDKCKEESGSSPKKEGDSQSHKEPVKSSTPKPLWLQDLYQPLDSVRKKSMGHGSHYKDSSEEEEVFSRANFSGPSNSRRSP